MRSRSLNSRFYTSWRTASSRSITTGWFENYYVRINEYECVNCHTQASSTLYRTVPTYIIIRYSSYVFVLEIVLCGIR